jgi:hypothetical protein
MPKKPNNLKKMISTKKVDPETNKKYRILNAILMRGGTVGLLSWVSSFLLLIDFVKMENASSFSKQIGFIGFTLILQAMLIFHLQYVGR